MPSARVRDDKEKGGSEMKMSSYLVSDVLPRPPPVKLFHATKVDWASLEFQALTGLGAGETMMFCSCMDCYVDCMNSTELYSNTEERLPGGVASLLKCNRHTGVHQEKANLWR